MIQSQYFLESFKVNEFSTSYLPSKEYQFLDIIYKNIRKKNKNKLNFKTIEAELESKSNNNLQNDASINYESMIIIGYIHQFEQSYNNNIKVIKIPNDIIQLINAFYPSLTVASIICNGRDNVIELWESTACNKSHWYKLYKYVHMILFVVDLSCFDEYIINDDGQNVNKMVYTVELFKSVIAEKYLLSKKNNIVVLFNKVDLFEEKIKNNIPLDECKFFSDIINLDNMVEDYDKPQKILHQTISNKFIDCKTETIFYHFTDSNTHTDIYQMYCDCQRTLTIRHINMVSALL